MSEYEEDDLPFNPDARPIDAIEDEDIEPTRHWHVAAFNPQGILIHLGSVTLDRPTAEHALRNLEDKNPGDVRIEVRRCTGRKYHLEFRGKQTVVYGEWSELGEACFEAASLATGMDFLGDTVEIVCFDDTKSPKWSRVVQLKEAPSLLSFETPKRARSKEEHAKYSFDGGPAGGYVPNMSREDQCKWKAKHVTGQQARVEVRKTLGGVQLKMVVYAAPGTYSKHASLRSPQYQFTLSMNGTLMGSLEDFSELVQAFTEAHRTALLQTS